MKSFQGFKFIIATAIFSMAVSVNQSQAEIASNEITFNQAARVMILAPHPDDESLCCAGIIQKAVRENVPVKIVYLTHGDNNEWSFLVSEKKPILNSAQAKRMGMMRSREASDAAAVLGIEKDNVIFMGYPDSGGLAMWNEHWQDSSPYPGSLTKAKKVPYQNAYRRGADHVGDEVLQDLKSIFKKFAPTHVFVSHPADRNGDHRAFYFFARAALWDLRMKPKIFPYLIHYKKWPKPKGYFPDKQMWIPAPLMSRIEWKQLRLNEQEIHLKHEAIKKHRTQMAYSKKFMTSFVRRNENFGDYRDIALKSREEQSENKMQIEFGSAEDFDTHKGAVMLDGRDLVIQIDLTGLVSGALKFDLSIYGHNNHVSFERMPKFHVRCGITDCEVFDGGMKHPNQAVTISKEGSSTVFAISMRDLGYPNRVMIGMSTLLGDQTMKLLPGRFFEIASDSFVSEL